MNARNERHRGDAGKKARKGAEAHRKKAAIVEDDDAEMREAEEAAYDDLSRQVQLLEGRLNRGELGRAVAMSGIVAVARQKLNSVDAARASRAAEKKLAATTGLVYKTMIMDEVPLLLDDVGKTLAHVDILDTEERLAMRLGGSDGYGERIGKIMGLRFVDYRTHSKEGGLGGWLFVGSLLLLLDRLLIKGDVAEPVFLDVGCGAGIPSIVVPLMDDEFKSVGFDVDSKAVEEAKRNRENVVQQLERTTPGYSALQSTKFRALDLFAISALNPATHVYMYAPNAELAFYYLKVALRAGTTVRHVALAYVPDEDIQKLESVLVDIEGVDVQTFDTYMDGHGTYRAFVIHVPNDDVRAKLFDTVVGLDVEPGTEKWHGIPDVDNHAIAELVAGPEIAPPPPPPQAQPQGKPPQRRVTLVSSSGPQ